MSSCTAAHQLPPVFLMGFLATLVQLIVFLLKIQHKRNNICHTFQNKSRTDLSKMWQICNVLGDCKCVRLLGIGILIVLFIYSFFLFLASELLELSLILVLIFCTGPFCAAVILLFFPTWYQQWPSSSAAAAWCCQSTTLTAFPSAIMFTFDSLHGCVYLKSSTRMKLLVFAAGLALFSSKFQMTSK